MENNNLVHRYLKGLQDHLSEEDKLSLSYASGATAAQLNKKSSPTTLMNISKCSWMRTMILSDRKKNETFFMAQMATRTRC